MVQFEREEAEKRLKPIRQSDENLSVIEAKPPSPAEKVETNENRLRHDSHELPTFFLQVLDVVRAVETLAQGPIENSVPPKSPNSELKTTTIVMSKHTLAAQPTTVSVYFSLVFSVNVFEALMCFCGVYSSTDFVVF